MKAILRHALLAALLAASASSSAGYRYLNVNLVTQEHSNWCWAAVAVDVLRWYGSNPSQCGVVNWAYGRNDACGNGVFNWNSGANTPNGMYGQGGSIQSILSNWGLSSSGYGYALSWNAVVNDVNANRPFVMRFGWYSGGGHFIVGYGYDDRSGTQRVAYMNPWPGEGYTWSNYNWTVSAAYDHSWTHTLRMNR